MSARYRLPESLNGIEVVGTGTYVSGNWPVLEFPGGGRMALEPHLLAHLREPMAEPPNGSIWLYEYTDQWNVRIRSVWQRDDERGRQQGAGNWWSTLHGEPQIWDTLAALPGTWNELAPVPAEPCHEDRCQP